MPQWLLARKRSHVIVLLAAATALAAFVLAFASLWRARRVLQSAVRAATVPAGISFSLEPLPVARPHRFSPLFDNADFRSATMFNGELFVCGRSSLTHYGIDGTVKHSWRVGQDLPSYPLVSLAVRRGVGTPELWIGTEGAGVLIFDGQLLKAFKPQSQSLRKISALLPLRSGRMILGVGSGGLYVTDGKLLEEVHPQFAHVEVTALAGDEDDLWIGTRRGGLWHWHAAEATHFDRELPDPQVLALYADGESAWAGTPLGVAEFKQGQWRRTLAEGVFAQTLQEHAGTLSIGTLEQGVLDVALTARISRVSQRQVALTETEANASANILALEDAGTGLLAVTPGAVLRAHTGELIAGPAGATLADSHISALAIDRRGRLWIGYFDHGLDIADLGGARKAEHSDSDVLFCVNRIKEDPEQGTIAVATANGLALFDSSAQLRQILDRKSGLISNDVTDLLFQPASANRSTSFAAATPAGISYVDGGAISSVSAFQGLVNNHVYTLAERNGTLFAGTLGGLSVIQSGSVQASYTTANSTLRQNWITASVADGENLYLGTYGSGVVRLGQDKELASFREFAKRRVEINPNALLATESAIYAGTAGEGLAVLHRGQARWQFVTDGLPSLNVTALAARNGVLYVGTDNGLVDAPERTLHPE